ncbi:hypothetical protein VTK56DRAFT_8237 [Thermocarpiscus australiensis]
MTGAPVPMQAMPPVGVLPMTAPVTPIVLQQPAAQPIMVQAPVVAPGAVPGGQGLLVPAQTVPGNPPFAAPLPAQPPVHVEPVLGVGLTPNETLAQNVRIAQDNKCYEPQEFKPADPDPLRLYWFRELNGHWAVFPRRAIDRLGKNARWYRTDQGVFYAVRLAE